MPFIQLQFRRDTSTNWYDTNPTLASGEMAIELDTNTFKIGDGRTSWRALPYGGIQGPRGPQGPAGGGSGSQGGSGGAQGPTGPAGANGTNGAEGTPGSQGSQGPTGPSGGPIGPTGPAGTNGTPGAQGPTGPAGPVGPAGSGGGVISKFKIKADSTNPGQLDTAPSSTVITTAGSIVSVTVVGASIGTGISIVLNNSYGISNFPIFSGTIYWYTGNIANTYNVIQMPSSTNKVPNTMLNLSYNVSTYTLLIQDINSATFQSIANDAGGTGFCMYVNLQLYN